MYIWICVFIVHLSVCLSINLIFTILTFSPWPLWQYQTVILVIFEIWVDVSGYSFCFRHELPFIQMEHTRQSEYRNSSEAEVSSPMLCILQYFWNIMYMYHHDRFSQTIFVRGDVHLWASHKATNIGIPQTMRNP